MFSAGDAEGPGAAPPVWADFRRPSERGFSLSSGPAITPPRMAPGAPGPGVGQASLRPRRKAELALRPWRGTGSRMAGPC